MRAAQLWKLLGDDVSSAPPADDAPPVTEPETPSKSWADDELGELLARAWYETVEGEAPASTPVADDWSQPATWEVERLPSASEGGIAALFGGPPGGAPSRAPKPTPPEAVVPVVRAVDEVAPVSDEVPAEPGMGRALLAEMIEQLPTEPTPRVTPADIHIEPPVVAPVAIWFWGDDDIYPGRVASAGSPTVANAMKKSRKPAKADKPRRKGFTVTRKPRAGADA
jgi:hypothetical protein